MIKSITVTNYLGDTLKMELTRPELSGFIIRNIDGLDPPKATVNIKKSATSDGGQFNSAYLNERNIVIDLVYMEGLKESIEDLRQKSYKYFPIKTKVKILIETDNRISETEGIVENNDVAIFEKREGGQISIQCPNSYLYSAGANGNQTTVFSGVEPMFEFPFCNDSLTEPLLIMGEIRNELERVITYVGDAEVGITINIYAIGEANHITIYNMDTRESIHIDTDKLEALTGTGITVGDEITICTVKKQKSATLIRAGKTINILNCIARDVDWFELTKGDNTFAYTAEYGSSNLQFKITNRIIYEGA